MPAFGQHGVDLSTSMDRVIRFMDGADDKRYGVTYSVIDDATPGTDGEDWVTYRIEVHSRYAHHGDIHCNAKAPTSNSIFNIANVYRAHFAIHNEVALLVRQRKDQSVVSPKYMNNRDEGDNVMTHSNHRSRPIWLSESSQMGVSTTSSRTS